MSARHKLTDELARRGVRVTRHGDQLEVIADAGALTESRLHWLRAHKAELLIELAANETTGPIPQAAAVAVSRPVVRFRPPGHGWAVCLGRAGDSRDDVVADLRGRWPQAEIEQESAA
jgi:hypothetical protein